MEHFEDSLGDVETELIVLKLHDRLKKLPLLVRVRQSLTVSSDLVETAAYDLARDRRVLPIVTQLILTAAELENVRDWLPANLSSSPTKTAP